MCHVCVTDNMDLNEDAAEAQKLAEKHMDCWNRLQAKRLHRLRSQPPVDEDLIDNGPKNHNPLAQLLENLENRMGLGSEPEQLMQTLHNLETAVPHHCPENLLADQIRTLGELTEDEKKRKEERMALREEEAARCAPCETDCFTSMVSAVWWAGLGKDRTLYTLATADLQADPKRQRTMDAVQFVTKLNGFTPRPQDATDASQVEHVQVLVTGSVALVGGVLSLIKPDIWE